MVTAALGSPAMAARRDLKATPKAYLIDETTWPEGPLKEPKPEVEFLMEIARRLKEQVDATSNRAVARAAGIRRRALEGGANPQPVDDRLAAIRTLPAHRQRAPTQAGPTRTGSHSSETKPV